MSQHEKPTLGESPAQAQLPPGIPWDRTLRMLCNLHYGQEVNIDDWSVPRLKARAADTPDRELAIRLTEAFHRALKSGGATGDGLWESMSSMFHKPFIKMLEHREYDQIAETLAGLFYSPVATGICRRPEDAEAFADDPKLRVMHADVVASLGMATGTISVPNPAVAFPPNLFELDYDDILNDLENHLGWDLSPPQVGGIFGVEFKGNLIPLKHFYQVYTANRIKMIAGGPVESCLEIGGGVGFLAYACVKSKTVRDYCIVDLPIVNILQGYVLLKSDLAEYVELYGEESTTTTPDAPRIRILPDMEFANLTEKSFEFSVNQDSFTELAHDTMCGYLEGLKKVTRSYLLSINHESGQVISHDGFKHGRVFDVIKAQPEYRLLSRMPYWMRPGYVEELYKIAD